VNHATPTVPEHARETVQALHKLIASGREVTRAELEGLHRAHPSWFEPLELLLEQLLEENDAPAVEACRAHAETTWPEMQESFLVRAMLHRDTNQSDKALEIAYEGLRRPIVDVQVVRSLLILVKTVGGRRAVREAPLPVDVATSLAAKDLMFLSRLFFQCGDPARSRALRAVAAERDPAVKVPPIVDGDGVDWESDMVSIQSPGSDTAVVVFTGLMHETGVPIEVLHAQLEPLSFHFVALRDLGRLVFLNGHPRLGAGPAVAAQRLRQHVEAMGAKKILVLGNSAGCVAALLYGALLKADGIVCFGPIASMTAPFETRGKAVARRVRQLVDPQWLAPPVELLQACDPAIPVLVHYGELMSLDRQHAETIATLPRAELEPLPGHDRHDVLRELIGRGLLVPRLAEFVANATGQAPGA